MSVLSDYKKLMTARKLLTVCGGLQRDEKLLILTDPTTLRIGEFLATVGMEITPQTVMAVIPPPKTHGEEPPQHIIQAMADADLLMMPLKFSLTHAQATHHARKAGTRVVSMGDHRESMLQSGGLEVDFAACAPTVKKAGEFCSEWKHPATWINQGCWEDEIIKTEDKNYRDAFLRRHGATE